MADLPDPDTSALEAVLTGLYGESYAISASTTAEGLSGTPAGNVGELGIDWSKWTPGDTEAASKVKGPGLRTLLDSQHLDKALSDLTDTTVSRIGNAIAAGLKAGDSVDVTMHSISAIVDDDARAFQIADTETARAMTSASIDTMKANGVGEWDLLTAEGACAACTSIAAGNPHSVEDVEDQAPVHPVCRCACAPHVTK